jgi:nicotinamidase-related amidase
MELSDKTARQLWAALKQDASRPKIGFGEKAALINIDVQKAYTLPAEFKTAYETDPNQIAYINQLVSSCRTLGWPVIWTYVAYMQSGEDAGVWGTRTNTPDSLQNIKHGSRRAEFDDRADVDRTNDVIYCKRMASAFFETSLQSLLVWHKVDTVIITGGSTSGCVRATAVDALSRGYRVIVPEQCVADKHESPHFANLMDLKLKYADVLDLHEVQSWLDAKLAVDQSRATVSANT